MLGTSMEQMGCKRLILWKWGCREDIPLPFVKKNLMLFRGLKLLNELLEDAT
jgi:hypothetical protein